MKSCARVNGVTTCRRPVVSLSHTTKSCRVNRPLEHLLILCATRNAPACALSGMAESAIPMLLGVRRVAAFGFKVSVPVYIIVSDGTTKK